MCFRPSIPTGPGRNWPPTCGKCSKLARRFDAIDGVSMPKFWKAA